MVNGGDSLLNGQCFRRDCVSAARYFKMAADFENSGGMSDYAVCFKDGQGVRQDLVSAYRHATMSADLGSMFGMNNYAQILLQGASVPRDLVSAARCLTMSAGLRDPTAMYNCAIVLLSGQGVEHDFASTARSVKMSADRVNMTAMYHYATPAEKGQGVEPDLASAARYSKMSAGLGDSNAMATYRGCLLDGKGVAQDLVSPARYLKKSGDRGNLVVMCCYGLCVREGRDVNQDLSLAAAHFKYSADLGKSTAMRCCGSSLENGPRFRKTLLPPRGPTNCQLVSEMPTACMALDVVWPMARELSATLKRPLPFTKCLRISGVQMPCTIMLCFWAMIKLLFPHSPVGSPRVLHQSGGIRGHDDEEGVIQSQRGELGLVVDPLTGIHERYTRGAEAEITFARSSSSPSETFVVDEMWTFGSRTAPRGNRGFLMPDTSFSRHRIHSAHSGVLSQDPLICRRDVPAVATGAGHPVK
jgi:TPR repeat protein